MNARRCLKIAGRIGALLEKQIGVGVDATRMLTERLYMRDVLLVCDAHPGSELGQLAIWFRQCATEELADAAASAPRSGFGLDSLFGTSGFGSLRTPTERRAPAAAAFVMPKRAAQAASWHSPSRMAVTS